MEQEINFSYKQNEHMIIWLKLHINCREHFMNNPILHHVRMKYSRVIKCIDIFWEKRSGSAFSNLMPSRYPKPTSNTSGGHKFGKS